MKQIINDLFATLERLNKELDERVLFEHKLIHIIQEKDKQIEDLNKLIQKVQDEEIHTSPTNYVKSGYVKPKDLTETPYNTEEV